LGVRCAPIVKDPGNEEDENYWHCEYVKISFDSKTSFETLNPFSMY